MMKKALLFICCIVLISCGEKLVQEPEQLISKEKMADILYDLAILTAAKNTSSEILVKNKIETMDYIYAKYSIDSTQFVESNLYYASIPADYAAIHTAVDKRLESVQKKMEEARKIKADSIKEAREKAQKGPAKTKKDLKVIKADSLP
ncbi:DUF4296 domain-containing protein [Sediminicola sp. 1XM1-17]|uniref:DUF4296 domain-containing protein n=1 Tax=Sediminicola sp. 1XM1-17 TaxID=3127702 RepID=UPI003078155E